MANTQLDGAARIEGMRKAGSEFRARAAEADKELLGAINKLVLVNEEILAELGKLVQLVGTISSGDTHA